MSMFLRFFVLAPRTSIAARFVLFMACSCCNNELHNMPQVRSSGLSELDADELEVGAA